MKYTEAEMRAEYLRDSVKAYERNAEEFFGDGERFTGDQGYQDLLQDLSDAEDQLEEAESAIAREEMRELKDGCYKGTRILLGNGKRTVVSKMVDILLEDGFTEIAVPVLQLRDTFAGKVGGENQKMMFGFRDLADRDVVLAPEYTAVMQMLAKGTLKYEKDLRLFYVQECFRGEKPQAGRYRQFTQIGVEVINPTFDQTDYLMEMAKSLVSVVTREFTVDTDAVRGLDYYVGGKGFEISCESLGSSKQVCGGGTYDGGAGFAIGVDRLMLV